MYLGNLLCFGYFICDNQVYPGMSASIALLQGHEPSRSDPEDSVRVSGTTPFIGVLEDGTRGIVSRFVHDTELVGLAGTAAGCIAAQKDVGRLEKWAERKLIKVNKGKDKVLPLGRHNAMDQYWGLGADCLESRFLEKDQGVVVANNPATSQQCSCVAKQADSLLGCVQERFASRWREVILPL
ncbi:hypothetical protein QYF61_021348 [Mycteria americana]|uniref:Uncharacterized protein n=1 Tax=Mycteria americana TaxID=33587 RepID=A0AAN7MYV7_MYCAM|nr:hypothetical protein QYF61_021348 [Mycteria americana]